ncbi:putative cytochrome P450 alkane hydroxylase [Bisporella sp. PMI_857]|nr:putative cytochrome P450 alkane hydroxylase [Bisporella sp. PMI_857]
MPYLRDIYRWPLAVDIILKTFAANRNNQLLRLFVEVTTKLPHTFEQKLLGAIGINTLDPKNIESLLSTQFDAFTFGDRAKVFAPLLGQGIFTQDGDDWKRSRDLLRPLFLSNRVDHFVQIKQHVEKFVSNIPEGQIVDFQPLFFRFTLDTTTFLLFGRALHGLGSYDPASEEFAEGFRVAQAFLARRARLGPFYWLIGGKEFNDACATVHNFLDGIIKEAVATYHLNKPGVDYGFLGSLIQFTQDPKVLRDQTLNVLLAGRDTTACCLTWALRLLVKHQDVLAKLRKEIKRIVGVGVNAQHPDRHDLKKMRYLSYVLKEVLRLYPSVPINNRGCAKTTLLPIGGGKDGTSPVLVRAGQPVGYCPYVMHRRKELYGNDAEKFRPERWDPEENNEVNLKSIGWGWLPFNGGPRVCLGQEFALLESSYVIVRLLQTFSKLEYDPARPMPEVGEERQEVTLVLQSADGCYVRASY